MPDRSTYEYRIKQLDKMIAYETDLDQGGYGARLSCYQRNIPTLTVDAEDLKVLRDHYVRKSTELCFPFDELRLRLPNLQYTLDGTLEYTLPEGMATLILDGRDLYCQLPKNDTPIPLKAHIDDIRKGDAFFAGNNGQICVAAADSYWIYESESGQHGWQHGWNVNATNNGVYHQEDIDEDLAVRVKNYLLDFQETLCF